MKIPNKSFCLDAHAKINLFLKVGPRQSNGYHSLCTLFQEIALGDSLIFSPTDGPIELQVRFDEAGFAARKAKTRNGMNSARLSSGADNLVVRALSLLKKKLKVRSGARVQLVKRIPMGAGLGGGSSDAAAALWGGWILWKQGRRDYERRKKHVPAVLKACAAQLGSDVTFFLSGGFAMGEGRGEILTPFPKLVERTLLVVYPRVHVSTKVAYGLLDQSRRRATQTFDSGLDATGIGNDFEPVVLRKFPKILEVRNRLELLGCHPVQMSGSGSAVFGFVPSEKDGRRWARLLSREPWDVFLTRTVL